jgi:hypothetical protein
MTSTEETQNLEGNTTAEAPEIPDWKSTLPEEIRPVADGFQTPADVVKAYAEAQAFATKKVNDFTRGK